MPVGGPPRVGPPGPPGMMRTGTGRPGGVQADVWARGTQQAPLTPAGMSLSGIQLHKTEKSYKVGLRNTPFNKLLSMVNNLPILSNANWAGRWPQNTHRRKKSRGRLTGC